VKKSVDYLNLDIQYQDVAFLIALATGLGFEHTAKLEVEILNSIVLPVVGITPWYRTIFGLAATTTGDRLRYLQEKWSMQRFHLSAFLMCVYIFVILVADNLVVVRTTWSFFIQVSGLWYGGHLSYIWLFIFIPFLAYVINGWGLFSKTTFTMLVFTGFVIGIRLGFVFWINGFLGVLEKGITWLMNYIQSV